MPTDAPFFDLDLIETLAPAAQDAVSLLAPWVGRTCPQCRGTLGILVPIVGGVDSDGEPMAFVVCDQSTWDNLGDCDWIPEFGGGWSR